MTRLPADFERACDFLVEQSQGAQAELLRQRSRQVMAADQHGHLEQWQTIVDSLPDIDVRSTEWNADTVAANGPLTTVEHNELSELCRKFHPWRKGPFRLFDIPIDTEWRSDWKWQRIQNAVELRNRMILDVGCGNGYFGWRMLGAGAKAVIGIDPFHLFVMQHQVLKNYLGPDQPNFVLPLTDNDLPRDFSAFDVVFSMGVLYHRTSPIEHLQTLNRCLAKNGQLVLETLILDQPEQTVFMPPGRYAKMRNVWFLPTIDMLRLWLHRTGFKNVEVVNVTVTSTQEQRATPWMTFESLADFLDPKDSSRTIEGHPAPVRAMLTADRK